MQTRDKYKKCNFTYVSLFSGAGIGSYGFKQEGFQCIATNEIIEKRLQIQQINQVCRYDTGYIQGDIRENHIKHIIYIFPTQL